MTATYVHHIPGNPALEAHIDIRDGWYNDETTCEYWRIRLVKRLPTNILDVLYEDTGYDGYPDFEYDDGNDVVEYLGRKGLLGVPSQRAAVKNRRYKLQDDLTRVQVALARAKVQCKAAFEKLVPQIDNVIASMNRDDVRLVQDFSYHWQSCHNMTVELDMLKADIARLEETLNTLPDTPPTLQS